MANDDSKLFNISKILNGVVGLLLAIVGYFIVGHDAEIKETIRGLWQEIASLKNSSSECRGAIQKLDQTHQWILEQEKDREQRIRALENRAR